MTRLARQRRRSLRGAVLYAVAAAVTAASVGIPLPHVIHVAGEPFPCQGHACGCSDAGRCWQQCCCFTHAQKLAWARQQGVTPPRSVVLAAAQAAQAAKEQDSDALPPCCAARLANSASASHEHCDRDSGGGELCTSEPARGAEPAESRVAKSSPRVAWAMAFAALQCHGVHISVALLPPSLPPVRPAALAFVLESEPLHATATLAYASPILAIETPPPRSAVC